MKSKRTLQLELLIAVGEADLRTITPAHMDYARRKNYVEELRLEYREREGHEYQPNNAHRVDA